MILKPLTKATFQNGQLESVIVTFFSMTKSTSRYLKLQVDKPQLYSSSWGLSSELQKATFSSLLGYSRDIADPDIQAGNFSDTINCAPCTPLILPSFHPAQSPLIIEALSSPSRGLRICPLGLIPCGQRHQPRPPTSCACRVLLRPLSWSLNHSFLTEPPHTPDLAPPFLKTLTSFPVHSDAACCHLLALFPCLSSVILPEVPPINQTPPYPEVFAFAVPSTWNAVLPASPNSGLDPSSLSLFIYFFFNRGVGRGKGEERESES